MIKCLLYGSAGKGNLAYMEGLVQNKPDNVDYYVSRYLAHRILAKKIRYHKKIETKKLNALLNVIGVQSPWLTRLFNTKCDIIHSHNRLLLNDDPWILSYEYPTILHFRRARWVGPEPNYPYPPPFSCLPGSWYVADKIIEKILISKSCKKIIPFSYIAKRALLYTLCRLNVPEEKIKVIYPIISLPEKIPTKKGGGEGKTKILFVGNDFYRKGGPAFLKVFTEISKHLDVFLLIRSDIPVPFRKKIESMSNVKVLSRYPREKLLTEIFPESDIFCVPSLGDSLAIVYLEATACGLPVVATDVGATPEIIKNNKTGFIVPLNEQGKVNTVELKEKLEILVKSRSLRERMGREGRARFEQKFSTRVLTPQLGAVYEEAVKA